MGYRERCISEKGEECATCGNHSGKSEIVVHHRDGDRQNNSISNLTPLCRLCHRKVHRRNHDANNEAIQSIRNELDDKSWHGGGANSGRRNSTTHDMARNQRINLSLPPDVVDVLDDQENMSGYVAEAVREYDG